MSGVADDIVIHLSRAKALALFEWAYQFMVTHDSRLTHPADAVAIDALATELEWALPEVFTAEYPALLAAGRARVEAEYRDALGPQHSAWLASLAYQDAPASQDAEPGAAADTGRPAGSS